MEKILRQLNSKYAKWAFGAPIANSYWGAAINSDVELILPEGKKSRYPFENLKPSAFKRIQFVGENRAIPILSKEDTIILMLKSHDPFSAYVLYRNNNVNNEYLAERIIEEDNQTIYALVYGALRHFKDFKKYASQIENKIEKKRKEYANSFTKDFLESQYRLNYPKKDEIDMKDIIEESLDSLRSI